MPSTHTSDESLKETEVDALPGQNSESTTAGTNTPIPAEEKNGAADPEKAEVAAADPPKTRDMSTFKVRIFQYF